MLLYNCTICALYPSLYTGNLPSSTTSLDVIEKEIEDEMENKSIDSFNPIKFKNETIEYAIKPDLETTSEGLCDHIREIFGLSRQIFNDYQVRAMKKLLIRKSHPQVVFLGLLNLF